MSFEIGAQNTAANGLWPLTGIFKHAIAVAD